MKLGRRHPRSFYARSSLDVASDLIGSLLVHDLTDGTHLALQLVEVEAYLGDGTDPASHAHCGPTERNRTMFGPPGRLYAYLSYGIHTCVNVVCEVDGRAAAVLLRAGRPLRGVDAMRSLRGLDGRASPRLVASGPGRLAQAMGLSLGHDGRSLLSGALRLHPRPESEPTCEVGRGPRIGISKAKDLPYRYYAIGDLHVSGPARMRR